ncbi:bestrophin-like domain [Bradyrhizobium sp.]|uniref:bestrophin-like domain n=1 Tax=Bradyrhizobium sp. TaxID=376 RepID=UPI002B750352|nr:DUF4239 domain-containing protein [Bradyrhizobium sp.]HMM91106.1 DUF4239 domain-containing protein [Bradyrhizobium sp.]
MSSTEAFLASFAAILIGAAAGMGLRRALPAEWLEGGAKEAIRLGAGLLSTLAALVIGLMIASAKNTFDNQNSNIRQLGTNAALADQMLTKYGPEAKAARTLLREIIPSATARIWRENNAGKGREPSFVVSEMAERFFRAVEGLNPANAEQTSLKSRIIQITTDMGRTRLLVFTQADDAIPLPFFIVLVFWLVVIFASFSLFAEPGLLVMISTLVFALSVSSALFLIVDLSHPFQGLMQISNHHLQMVLPKVE